MIYRCWRRCSSNGSTRQKQSNWPASPPRLSTRWPGMPGHGNWTSWPRSLPPRTLQAEGPWIEARHLPVLLAQADDAVRWARKSEEIIVLEKFLGEIERELIERALERAKGNKTRAAKLLGMTRPRLYRRLVQLGMIRKSYEC